MQKMMKREEMFEVLTIDELAEVQGGERGGVFISRDIIMGLFDRS